MFDCFLLGRSHHTFARQDTLILGKTKQGTRQDTNHGENKFSLNLNSVSIMFSKI